jgi:3'-phosphoadenosine 5'-phosphosulfate sulfotransferase (PAPS reductase)/FAD synthetase
MSLVQLPLYPPEIPDGYPVSVDDLILKELSKGAPVAVGVSGGKDSSAVAVRTIAFLNEVGHSGPRVLIHSDLGRLEWQQSLPSCRRLADHLGVELVVVRRGAGDLFERWRQRWTSNVLRYASLSCVQLIPPWSTPSMRFCTSELKLQVICQELVKRFPGRVILSVSGIRRDESRAREKAPTVRPQARLLRKKSGTCGFDWHPILHWTLDQVFAYLMREHISLHEAYTTYGSSRVSCAFCILASCADLLASSRCEAHQQIYRQLVELEIESTFSFQAGRWLADVAPHLLSNPCESQIAPAKARASLRETAEAEIPRTLLYTKGWPTRVPTHEEAALLARIRGKVSDAVGISIAYREPAEILAKYTELIDCSRKRIIHDAELDIGDDDTDCGVNSDPLH